MSDELDKMANEFKKMKPSTASRERGLNAAMAAFDAEFTAETAIEKMASEEKISEPNQGFSDEPRPMSQSPRKKRVQTSRSSLMQKLSDIFTVNPRTAMMGGSCMAALIAAVVVFQTDPFQDFQPIEVKPPVTSVEALEITPSEPSKTESATNTVPSPDQSDKKTINPTETPVAITPPQTVNPKVKPSSQAVTTDERVVERPASIIEQKTPPAPAIVARPTQNIEESEASLKPETVQSAPQSQGITSVNGLLSQVQSDSMRVEAEAPQRMTKFRNQRDSSASVLIPPSFETPQIDRSSFKIPVSDRDAQPLVRIAPILPSRAERSGHCSIKYDVNSKGVPFNVTTTQCTEPVFKSASINAVKKWKFSPKIVNGRAVARSGVETKVRFRLMDERGNIIPEPKNYEKVEDFESNPVTLVTETPVSTFSVDVDTASYSFLRSSLNQGRLPSPGTIRLEEMINYFPYDYTAPTSPDEPFKANVTVTPNPWNADTKLMHIGIKGYVPPADEKPDSNIVLLIDTSGSMNQSNKLPLLINSFKLLLNTLDADDTVSIVTYAGSAGTVLEPTPASDKTAIKSALENLRAGGSTAGATGLTLAYQKATENFKEDGVNRVILATDGDFNVGFSTPDEMKTFIKKKRETGVFLSVLGFGRGNYNDALMQSIAQNGNGTAAYIDTLSEANKVLANEASSSLITIAKDVKIQVEFNPATIAEYRLIGYETRALKREDFNNDKVDAGEIGAGHTVTAIYEMTPVDSPAKVFDTLRYVDGDKASKDTRSDEYAFVKIRHKLPNANESTLQTFPIGEKQERNLRRADNDMRFATAVAAVGQKLRGQSQLSDFSYQDAIDLASEAKGEDKYGYRAEFIQLVRLIQNLEE